MTFANTPAPAAPLSVTQAIHLAAQSVASVPTMTIVGEVSGFRGPNARSGHYYFQLKDKTSKIEVCLWKGRYDQVGDRLSLRDGLRVQMTGSFNVYEPWGKLSFVIDSVALEGEGDLLSR